MAWLSWDSYVQTLCEWVALRNELKAQHPGLTVQERNRRVFREHPEILARLNDYAKQEGWRPLDYIGADKTDDKPEDPALPLISDDEPADKKDEDDDEPGGKEDDDKVATTQQCTKCDGSGYDANGELCDRCEGSGYEPVSEENEMDDAALHERFLELNATAEGRERIRTVIERADLLRRDSQHETDMAAEEGAW